MSASMLAALCAWMVAQVDPLRSALVLSAGEEPVGLSLVGVSVLAAPLAMWACARVFNRAITGLSGLLLWMFAVSLGVAANTLSFLTIGNSVVSVFVLVGAGFGALILLCRLNPAPLSLLSAIVFALVGLGGGDAITLVLPSAWPFIATDVVAVALVATLVLTLASAFRRIQGRLADAHDRLVDYGALTMLVLAEPPLLKHTGKRP